MGESNMSFNQTIKKSKKDYGFVTLSVPKNVKEKLKKLVELENKRVGYRKFRSMAQLLEFLIKYYEENELKRENI